MEAPEHVCSLDLARKLQSLKISGRSAYSWYDTGGSWRLDDEARLDAHESVRTFTVAELGATLNDLLGPDRSQLCYTFKRGSWYGRWSGSDVVDAESEADARAKLIIFLVEQKLVTIPVHM